MKKAHKSPTPAMTPPHPFLKISTTTTTVTYLTLEDAKSEDHKVASHHSSCAHFHAKKEIKWEPAGKAYHAVQRKASGLAWDHHQKKKIVPVAAAASPSPSASPKPNEDEDEFGSLAVNTKDYYAILGLEVVGLNASDKQIKKAYQEMLLKTHPDKMKTDASKDEIAQANQLFRDVQIAYDVLSNLEKRRGYDSQFDFDDWIPIGYETLKDEKAFFDLYGPVFQANARFSTTKPVPMLGGPEDDEATVKMFYTFWRAFKSWRDFSAYDEFKDGDLETAEGRDHRRHMIKKNEAIREKMKKKENTRLQSLVDRASKNDPRAIKYRAEAERLKNAAVNAKENAKKSAEDAKKAADEAAEKLRLETQLAESENKEVAKKRKEEAKSKQKKAMRALREAVGTLYQGSIDNAPADIQVRVQEFTSEEPESIKVLADEIIAAKSLEPFERRCKEIIEGRANEKNAEEERKKTALEDSKLAAQKVKDDKPRLAWSPEAMSFLAKGMAKHPGGTRNRWECVATYVVTSGFICSADDCIEAAKKIQPGPKPTMG